LLRRHSPIAVIGATAKAAAAIKRAIKMAAAAIGETTTTAGIAARMVPDQARAVIRPDPQVVQAAAPVGVTATTTRPVRVAAPAAIGKTRLARAADPARRRIVAAGAIATTTRPVRVAAPAVTGKIRLARAVDPAPRRIGAAVTTGVTVVVATTTGAMVAVATEMVGATAAAVTEMAGGTVAVATETVGGTAAGTDVKAGVTTAAVGPA